jgi:hypothetical protein|tara:strand:+ start:254 stop:694 length:441 start_codon:yes stop_codon:yes gene_type:complete
MTNTVNSHISSFSEKKIMSSKNTIEIIFPNTKTRKAAKIFVDWIKKQDGIATKNAVSEFANSLNNGTNSEEFSYFKYSRRNFYMTVLRKLIDMGFIQHNVPIWDSKLNKTIHVYKINIFDIPKKPPQIGFWKLSYYMCKKWNKLFF